MDVRRPHVHANRRRRGNPSRPSFWRCVAWREVSCLRIKSSKTLKGFHGYPILGSGQSDHNDFKLLERYMLLGASSSSQSPKPHHVLVHHRGALRARRDACFCASSAIRSGCPWSTSPCLFPSPRRWIGMYQESRLGAQCLSRGRSQILWRNLSHCKTLSCRASWIAVAVRCLGSTFERGVICG